MLRLPSRTVFHGMNVRTFITVNILIKAQSKNNRNLTRAPLERKKYFGHLGALYLEMRLLIRTNLWRYGCANDSGAGVRCTWLPRVQACLHSSVR